MLSENSCTTKAPRRSSGYFKTTRAMDSRLQGWKREAGRIQQIFPPRAVRCVFPGRRQQQLRKTSARLRAPQVKLELGSE